MKRILAAFLLPVLAGCVTTMPQTRPEFKDLVIKNPSWYVSEKYVSARSFEEVVSSLDKKWQYCYSAARTTTRTSGGMTTSRYRDIYHPKMKRINGSLVELTVQMTTEGMTMLDKTPPGGYYQAALDIKRSAGGKAALTWYSGNGWKKQWEKNKQWADGKNPSCED